MNNQLLMDLPIFDWNKYTSSSIKFYYLLNSYLIFLFCFLRNQWSNCFTCKCKTLADIHTYSQTCQPNVKAIDSQQGGISAGGISSEVETFKKSFDFSNDKYFSIASLLVIIKTRLIMFPPPWWVNLPLTTCVFSPYVKFFENDVFSKWWMRHFACSRNQHFLCQTWADF